MLRSSCIPGWPALFELKNVGGVRAGDRRKAHAFVETRCVVVFGAQAHGFEVSLGLFDEKGDERAAYALIAPRGADVDAADATDFWGTGEGVEVQAADGYQGFAIEAAAK